MDPILLGLQGFATVLEREFSVQLIELALQARKMRFEFCIFGNQNVWNLEIIAAVAAYDGVVADIFGTK
jgi:hypothetical protein